jgi:hypothetical protein
MSDAGGSHGLRVTVDELPELRRRRVPGEELGDGHPDGDLGQRAHSDKMAGNHVKGKVNLAAAGRPQARDVQETAF